MEGREEIIFAACTEHLTQGWWPEHVGGLRLQFHMEAGRVKTRSLAHGLLFESVTVPMSRPAQTDAAR